MKSKRAIEFRRWASSVLKRYLLKGYAIDEKRLSFYEQSVIELSTKVSQIESEGKKTEKRVTKLEEALGYEEVPPESLFDSGEHFLAREYFRELFLRASQSVRVVDPYADAKVLSLLAVCKGGIPITLVKGSRSKLSDDDVHAFVLEYGNLTVKECDEFHDRYVFVDDECFMVGTSFNHMGKRIFSVVRFQDQAIVAGIAERIASL